MNRGACLETPRGLKPAAQLAVRLLLGSLLVGALGVAYADYAIDWHTIDGGGEMFTTGGNFELSGTIGQHDAATVVLTGGNFELTGGFWPGAIAGDPCAAFVCGDASCDGVFNGADIDPFFQALGDPAAKPRPG